MRCGVDKSCETDAQALGRPAQHHGTLKSAWHEKLSSPIQVATSSRVFSKRWFMPEGANVLLECSMQEGYAWDGERQMNQRRSLVAFLHGVGVLYEYLGWVERGICMITFV
jgi:hypothetical protein